jgi:hypothetical protein
VNALEQLRENLREAARRDIEAERARTRRRKRRATGLIAIALLGGAGAATAGQLISVGEPAEEAARDFEGPEYDQLRSTGPAAVRVVMTADAGAGRLPFGLGLYTAPNGQRCAHVGQVNRNALGVVEDGKWRPYSERKGLCTGRTSSSTADDFGDRTVVYGLAARDVRRVRVRGLAEWKAVGPEGAFMFVFERLPISPPPYVEFE